MLSVLCFAPQILIFGLEEAKPFYIFFLSLPMMLVGGGMEEAGWRYILQPALDKKFGFILSSVIVAPIWAVWHLPLFFIPGVGQYGTNFGLFALGVLGLTFVLGAIRKTSDNLFLCVLFHCIANAGTGTFILPQTPTGVMVTTGLIMIVSTVVVFVDRRKKKARIV